MMEDNEDTSYYERYKVERDKFKRKFKEQREENERLNPELYEMQRRRRERQKRKGNSKPGAESHLLKPKVLWNSSDRVRNWRMNHPDRIKAHRAVYVAKRNGTLKQQPCQECGREDTHAHHEDYSRPLDVVWLCPKHHNIYDAIRRKREKES